MEIKELKNFIFKFEQCDKEFVEALQKTLEHKHVKIFEFFGIKDLNPKAEVVVYNNIDDFKNLYKGTWQNFMRACVKNNQIHLLNLDVCRAETIHKNATTEDIQKILLHEIVHFCHRQVCPNPQIWLMEGLATNLAQQNYVIDKIDCTAKDLENNFYHTPKSYHYAHKIVEYLLENIDKNNLLKNFKKLNLKEIIKKINKK